MKAQYVFALALAASLPARADLPMMQEKPWIGFFIGFEDKSARFGISAKGTAIYEPLKSNGTPIASTNPIQLNFEIIETLPDGKTVRKMIDPEGFTSDSPAAIDPEKPVTIRGKVTGDATFEVTISEERGAISFTGRITDNGTLKNPLKLAISFNFLPYKYGGGIETPEQQKNFETKAKRDEMRLITLKGERVKLDFLDAMNLADKTKDGFASVEIRTEGYGGLRWNLIATPKSTLRFKDKGERPIWNGFNVEWSVNEGADAAAEKFTIEHE